MSAGRTETATVPGDAGSVLPAFDFADAYAVSVTGAPLDALSAAMRAFSRAPRWIGALMALRNVLVTPLGLVTASTRALASRRRVGWFPVIDENPHRVVLGLDDRHLDFRILMDVAGDNGRQRVTATTLVRTHNLTGRLYLAAVMPFHRIIVPAMLRRVHSA